MAILGSATILVRAITTGVEKDLKKTFENVSKEAEAAGKKAGESYNKGLKSGGRKNSGFFDDFSRSIGRLQNQTKGALSNLNMIETGFLNIGGVLTPLLGGIGALVTSLGALVGVLGAVGASSMAAVGALASLGAGAFAAKFALGGVGQAVSQASKATGGLSKSIKSIREELQQLTFDAEQASLSQKEAALNLEKARDNLARMQDLPPNSMARREAELQFEQAELAYRRAKDRAADLKEQVEEGVQDPTAAGGTDPYAELTKSQKEFAKRLVALQPILKSLKEEIAKGFLPALGDGIEKSVALLDGRLRPSLGRLGESLGRASTNFFDEILGDMTVTLFERFVDKSGPRIENFGSIFGKLFGAFLGILDAAAPLIDRFVIYLDEAAGRLEAFFSGGADDPKLVKFFESVGDTAADVGEIFGNLFSGLGVLIEVTTGPGSAGEYLLDWFKEITSGFKNMGDEEKGDLKQFFLDSAINAQKFLQLLGDIFGVFGDIGADPRLGETFDKLREATPFLEKIFDSFISVGPTIGQIFVDLAEIGSVLIDEGQLSAFFGTIGDIIGRIKDFFTTAEFKEFFDKWAPLIGTISAVGFLFVKFTPIFNAIGNAVFLVLNPISNLIGLLSGTGGKGGLAGAFSKIGGIGGIFKAIGGILRFLTGPIGLIITGFALMFTNSQMFRDSVFASFEALGEVFANIWNGSIKPVIGELSSGFEGIFTFIGELGRVVGDVLSFVMPLITLAIGVVAGAIGGLFEGIVGGFSIVVNVISGIINIIKGIIGLFIGVITGDWSMLQESFSGVWENIKNIFKGVIRVLLGIFRGLVNGFVDAWNGLTSKLKFTVPEWIPKVGGLSFSLPQIPRVPDLLVNFAQGGIVSPSAGGTIGRIAEAGRPERVEPLDPSGLSQRDRAMIQMLSGGGGGGSTIHVYPSPGMNEKDLAKLVSREIAVMTRKGSF
jgi:hypothetical protein